MNYNDIKNLNISKRGKKELLNALNKGGSGAGVTIVDSIDKLDENAPVGSLAVVAEEGELVAKKLTELYQLKQEDLIIDQENLTVEIANPEKLSLITSLVFKLPKSTLYAQDNSVLLIGNLNFFNSMIGGSQNPDVAKSIAGVMIGTKINDGIMTEIMAMCSIRGEEKEFNIMNYDGEKYVLNENDLESFMTTYENIDDALFYYCDLYSMMMGTALPEYLDEVITFYAGTLSNSLIYIKNNKWEEILNYKFNELQDELNRKQDIIIALDPGYNQDYYEIVAGKYYNIETTKDVVFKLKNFSYSNYGEYLIRLRSTEDTNITFVNDNDQEINIKWANQIALLVEADYDYVISIVNNLGVFLKF